MNIKKRIELFALLLFSSVVVQADTIELADGTILEGDFVGSSNGIIMFNTGSEIEAYPESEVVGIFLSQGVATAEALVATQPSTGITVPAGTRIMIRMSETVDSKRHKAGHRFRAQLEGALVVDGVTVAPKGTMLYGSVVASQQSGRAAGSSNLTIEFSDIMIDDQLYPIATGALAAQTGGEAGRTVGRTARAAAIGGLIDGCSGARTVAKVGAGASLLTAGASINVPSGTLLDTSLTAPLTVYVYW